MQRELPVSTRIGRSEFFWGKRTYVMGIVNVTPDSFSGDGLPENVKSALEQARRFEDEGADIIDVGGESTRPDAPPVSTEEELRRVIPVIERLAGAISLPLSVDTYKSAVARMAIEAGAAMLNDISALKSDPAMAKVAAEKRVPLVLMSNQRGEKHTHIVQAVVEDLFRAIEAAMAAGLARDNIIVDPGIGFGKTVEQNLELIRRLAELRSTGQPILLGTSRKSLIGSILDLPPHQRLEGTAATVSIGIANGADMVRVHDVQAMVRVCRMTDALVRG